MTTVGLHNDDVVASPAASRLTGSRPATCGSSGPRRVSSKPLHLSHLGPDCNPADVICFCKERRVTVTGCFFIRTRIWGTQSAKAYVDDSSLETVLRESFWPNLVECRRWETTPPANKRFESSKAMVEYQPERTSRGKSVLCTPVMGKRSQLVNLKNGQTKKLENLSCEHKKSSRRFSTD